MSLLMRNRVDSIDILQNDYEYCTISYYAEGPRNEFGELTWILLERATNVKCTINSLAKTAKSTYLDSSYEMTLQGIVEETTHHMIMSANQDIDSGDIVTDYDDVDYDVLLSIDWQTHKEVFLRKIG